jgi:hypothetical protein
MRIAETKAKESIAIRFQLQEGVYEGFTKTT